MTCLQFKINDRIGKKGFDKAEGVIVAIKGEYYIIDWFELSMKRKIEGYPLDTLDTCFCKDIEFNYHKID